MRNMRSSWTRPSSNQIIRVHLSPQMAQQPMWTQTCESHTPRKCIYFAKWRESIMPLSNIFSPQPRRLISRISVIIRKITPTSPWMTSSLAYKTTMGSWCRTNSSSARKLSIIQLNILNNQLQPYFTPSKNFSSSQTSPEHCTRNTKPSTVPTW